MRLVDSLFQFENSWKLHMAIILSVSLILHIISIFAEPVFLDPDSLSYFYGAITLADKLSFADIPSMRGPGMAILFAPHFLLFDTNATWPIKITFHLLAIGQVALVYGIVWILLKNRIFAFVCGLIAALSPSNINYANRLLSEIPSGFFAMLSTYLALLYFLEKKPRYLFMTSAALSFATLIRPENVIMVIIYFVVMIITRVIAYYKTGEVGKRIKHDIKYCFIALLIAALPLFAWATRNYQSAGIFSLTTYTDVALYDGWLDFATHYKVRVPVEASSSLKTIDQSISEQRKKSIEKGLPWDERRVVGWHAYYDNASLLEAGLSAKEANKVILQATIDFIKYYTINEPEKGLFLLRQKMENGIFKTIPIFWVHPDSPLPGEKGYFERPVYPGKEVSPIEKYISLKNSEMPFFILIQRKINKVYNKIFSNEYFNSVLYSWKAFCMLGFFFCLFIKPFESGLIFSIFTFSKIILPSMLSWAQLRLSMPGLFLYFIMCMVFSYQVVFYVISRLKLLRETQSTMK